MVLVSDIRQKYLQFFESKGHSIIPSAPLVPENDPTTLFTSSGMQPLVPYLLGQPHPLGKRLVDSQKSFRAQDIEEVGDNRHTTFFEMLGNWSLGDYFKSEQLAWFYEFLTQELELPKDRLYASVFEGNSSVPKDTESMEIWKKLGLPSSRIFEYGAKKNWWSRSGEPENMPPGEPGGPDSEVFFDFGKDLKLHENSPFQTLECHPNCDCGRFLEIGNSVFMQYQKQSDGSLKELPNKNVDFGGGLERLAAAVSNDPDVFKTDLFWPLIETTQKITGKSYVGLNQPHMRVISDHVKAATFLVADGVSPSNKAQGYMVRRLIRRAVTKLNRLQPGSEYHINDLVTQVMDLYKDAYFQNEQYPNDIPDEIFIEMQKFSKTLESGTRHLEKMSSTPSAHEVFDLYQTYGFPWELTLEILSEKGITVDSNEVQKEFATHQELSRTSSKGMFKGGLQDQSDTVVKYHTATHLLHTALRHVLGTHVQQKGSNLTAERLRFDFSHSAKLTSEELSKVEAEINTKITENIPVTRVEMPKTQALSEGALAFFPEKYPEVTSVYTIGDYSKELCGGPHVKSTGEIGKITLTREESAGAGVRRIYAQIAET